MKSLIETISSNQVYNSKELKDFFLSLENKYTITSEDKYYNLVNFSQNSGISYHKWFKYREGFSGALIDELINISSIKDGEVIVDPFCGSGTTLVSSVLKGYDTLGIDINPMSVEISKVKSKKYNQTIFDKIDTAKKALIRDFSCIMPFGFDNVSKYFSKINFDELRKIYFFVKSMDDEDLKEIFFTAYLSIIEDVSDRKRDGNGMKISISKVSDVLSFYLDKLDEIKNDMESILPEILGKSSVYVGSSMNIDEIFCKTFGDKIKAGAIIFSPPYANSFDYFESYKLELWMGGFLDESNKISDLRKDAVHSFVRGSNDDTKNNDIYVKLLAKEIQEAIPYKEKLTGRKDIRTRKVPDMILGYFSDMEEVIKKCSKILERGKQVFIVVDQSSYLGKIVPTDLLFGHISEKYDFAVREIIVCRPSKTSGQQLSMYPYLKNTLRESIVILEKK